MTSLTIGMGGEMVLPVEVQNRYHLKPETAVRIVETQSGILLVPLTTSPMTEELAQELLEWQSLGQNAWAAFAYEEEDP